MIKTIQVIMIIGFMMICQTLAARDITSCPKKGTNKFCTLTNAEILIASHSTVQYKPVVTGTFISNIEVSQKTMFSVSYVGCKRGPFIPKVTMLIVGPNMNKAYKINNQSINGKKDYFAEVVLPESEYEVRFVTDKRKFKFGQYGWIIKPNRKCSLSMSEAKLEYSISDLYKLRNRIRTDIQDNKIALEGYEDLEVFRNGFNALVSLADQFKSELDGTKLAEIRDTLQKAQGALQKVALSPKFAQSAHKNDKSGTMLTDAERLILLTLLNSLPSQDEPSKYDGTTLEDHFSAEQKEVFIKARKLLSKADVQKQRQQHLKAKLAAICLEADRIKELSEDNTRIGKILTDRTWNDIKAFAPKNCIN